MTANTRPEHTLLARQSRCLQGVCKCSSAAISHSVDPQDQYGERGVRLLIFHSTHASAQVAALVLSHTTAPVLSKFCLHGNECEDRQEHQRLCENHVDSSKCTLITMRRARLNAPCRSPPRHCASERGERTSSNHIEVFATWTFNCTR